MLKLKQLNHRGFDVFFEIANELDNVISLSIGEPDFAYALPYS